MPICVIIKPNKDAWRNEVKRSFCILLALVTVLLLITGCAGNQPMADGIAETTDKTETPLTTEGADGTEGSESVAVTEAPGPSFSAPLPKDKTYSVLFIGNSYTKNNSMPTEIFLPFARAAGYKVQVSTVLNGGHTLLGFANKSDTFGAQVAARLGPSNYGKYDYVVIQEQSLRPVTEVGKFYDGVRALTEMIRAAGATPVLYSTWGRKTGSADLADLNMTNESMTWALAAASEAIGRELDIPVAYTGLAFFDVYTNSRSIELYASDLYHPSVSGSYLAAATIFARIFGVDPVEVEYNAKLSAAEAKLLREAAGRAVFETPSIPEEYKMNSEGVVSITADTSMMKNLKKLPDAPLISVLNGGKYPNGKSFSGILGTKNKIASVQYSVKGLSDAQKADISDIGYGVSVIGVERMNPESKGYTKAIENLVNGHWGSSMMANLIFDDVLYDVYGNPSESGKYRALITLNFGRECTFNAIGFASGNLKGFPGTADVYVSSNGVDWVIVPSACWDRVNGEEIVACSDSKSLVDPWNGNTTATVCLFDMAMVDGVYVRIGVINGRNDKTTMYNTINTREILVFGEYK